MIIDIAEYVIFIFYSISLLNLGKPAGDSWGVLARDLQQYFLVPCRNPAYYQFCPPQALFWAD